MTGHTKRIRVTLPELEYARLAWLAAQAGVDAPTEAAMLLVAGIRKAVDGWRKLLVAPTATVEELDELLTRAVAGEPDEPRGDRTRDIEQPVGDVDELEVAWRSPYASDWASGELPGMPPEVP